MQLLFYCFPLFLLFPDPPCSLRHTLEGKGGKTMKSRCCPSSRRVRRLLLTAALLFLAAIALLLAAAFYPYPFAALNHPGGTVPAR